MRKVAIWLGTILAVIGLAAYASSFAPAGAASAAPVPVPAISSGHTYEFDNVQYGRWMHLHAHGSRFDDNSVASAWQPVNWSTHNGVSFAELEDGNSGLCANVANEGGGVFEVFGDSCVPGASSEAISVVPNNPSHPVDFWFIPLQFFNFSNYAASSGFFTDQGPSGYFINVNAPGGGNAALWQQFQVS